MSQPAVSLDDIGYQDLRIVDGSGRFCVPDIVFIHPGATTAEEERTAIALVVEVTSPTSPDTVLNDRATKPVQYAKAGVPLYLLVDQELGRWTLFGLAEGWQRYQIAADGAYGEENQEALHAAAPSAVHAGIPRALA